MNRLIPSLLACLILGTSAVGAQSASADPPRAVSEADRAIRTAHFESRRLLALLDQTRVRRDDQRARCVDERLAQVNSFSRTLLDRRRRLRATDDPAEIAHEREVIRNLAAQVREVAREGRACVFPPANQGHYTIVEVIAEPSMNTEDLSRVPDRGRR